MAQKSQGFIHLFWSCPNCKSQNTGAAKVCAQCGSPQPDQVEFYQQDASELIKDEAEIKKAALGPDINCPYCGTRNPADAQICTQCGGDISEGARRKTGQILGAYKPGQKTTVICPACGSENAVLRNTCHNCGVGLGKQSVNEETAPVAANAQEKKPRNPLAIGCLILAVMVICGFMIWGVSGLFSKDDLQGTVRSSQWQYTVNVERYGLVTGEDWQEDVPADATNLSCELRFHHEESEYVPGADEVCGTPYTVDKGNGYAEVVQDCVYRVSEPYCSYESMAWFEDTAYTSSGTDMYPKWPVYSLSADQRVAEEIESYTIIFSADGKEYQYNTSNFNEFSACKPGSDWNLTVNAFDAVLSISPIQ
jgi:hypothetical protein